MNEKTRILEDLLPFLEDLKKLLSEIPSSEWRRSQEIIEVYRKIQEVVHRLGSGIHIGTRMTPEGPEITIVLFPLGKSIPPFSLN